MTPRPPVTRLYVCGTAWGWERDRSNAGALEFYTSAAACRKARKCTDECGIVAVDVARVRWARRPRPAKQARRKQR